MNDIRTRPPRLKPAPIRTCVICRQQAGKRELMRIVRTEGGIAIDPTGKRPGRGAYLCENSTCWSRAASGEALAKALKTTLSPEDREVIRQQKAPSP